MWLVVSPTLPMSNVYSAKFCSPSLHQHPHSVLKMLGISHHVQFINHHAQFTNHHAQFINNNAQFTNHHVQFINKKPQFTNHIAQFIKHLAQFIPKQISPKFSLIEITVGLLMSGLHLVKIKTQNIHTNTQTVTT